MDQGVNEAVAVPAFRALLQHIAEVTGNAVELSAPNAFELLMPGDLPVRVTVHPGGEQLVIDLFVYNAVMLTGALRANVLQSALLINNTALRGRRFAVGLDNRDFVLLTSALPLGAGTADSFADAMEYLAAQAIRVRELIEQVTLAHAEWAVDFSTEPH